MKYTYHGQRPKIPSLSHYSLLVMVIIRLVLHTRPYENTSRKRLPFLNTKIFQLKALQLEPQVNATV